jgi:hypothetical protein
MFSASTSVGPSPEVRSGIERGPFVASEARGVGSMTSVSVRPLRVFFRPPRWRALAAIGVGISARAAPVRVGFPRMNVSDCRPQSAAIGVGRSVPCLAAVERLARLALGRSNSPPIPFCPFWLDP